MTIILTILLTLLTVIPAYSLDKKIGATNCFKIGIFSTEGNGIAGLDVATPFADFAVKLQCGAQTLVTMDETTDTVVDESGGYYYICTNDTIGNANEEECLAWIDGEGNYAGLIAKSPVKFKAIGATMGMIKYGATCDISAATSGTSFTIAACIDEDGSAITALTDSFTGHYLVAYTNGAAQCNVVNRGVFVGDITSGGVVTVKDSDLVGSGFPVTPNTTNCGVRASP